MRGAGVTALTLDGSVYDSEHFMIVIVTMYEQDIRIFPRLCDNTKTFRSDLC